MFIFLYNPYFVRKIKTIKCHYWHPEGKYWSFSNTNGTLEKILKVFEGEKIHLDPTLQARVSSPVIASPDKIGTKRSQKTTAFPSRLVGEGQGEGSFENLRRELLSRKYSYKTVKAYIYFNRDFLNCAGKKSTDIRENDIKDYPVYLAEKKRSATSTLIYEVQRPRKDRKLPVVLSRNQLQKSLIR